MRILARTVAPPDRVRPRLPWATVSDGGVIAMDVPPGELPGWSLEIANVVDELEGRPPLAFDESRTGVEIGGPTEKVFESLIDPELFERWFGRPLEIALHQGGRWSIGDSPMGTVVELVAGHRLVLAEDTSTVTWSLSELDSGTRLLVEMRGVDGPPPWPSWLRWLSAITQLRRLHEIPDRCPIWVT